MTSSPGVVDTHSVCGALVSPRFTNAATAYTAVTAAIKSTSRRRSPIL